MTYPADDIQAEVPAKYIEVSFTTRARTEYSLKLVKEEICAQKVRVRTDRME